MKTRTLGVVLGLALAAIGTLAAPAAAQTVSTSTALNARIYNAGASSPFSGPTQLASSAWTCNQTLAGSSAITAAPRKVAYDDPINPGKVCVYVDAGTGPLLSLPNDPTKLYELTLTNVIIFTSATNVQSTVESDESNRAPFARAAAPANTRVSK